MTSFFKKIPLSNEATTSAVAQDIAPLVRQGDVLTLQGALGAGKTTFACCLLRALDAKGDLTSPTFSLLHIHETRIGPVYHFDWYRLNQPQDVEEIGLDEALTEGATLIEWPERAPEYLPHEVLSLTFSFNEAQERWLNITAEGSSWTTRLQALFGDNHPRAVHGS